MGSERKLCVGIMCCQLSAILSGVSLLYLAVIVVIPSRDELAMGFSTTPIMCTTVKAEDIALRPPVGDVRPTCDWRTCSEWCLSQSSATCIQIHVMARRNGSKVTLHDCVDVIDKKCSAIDVNRTMAFKCREGQCHNLDGLYNCTKDDLNECREITAAFTCQNPISRETILCDTKACAERLDGVYTCNHGQCNKVKNVELYWKDCERKCSNLVMTDINSMIFGKDRLMYTTCERASSSSAEIDNNTFASISKDSGWVSKKKVALLFCTYIKKQFGLNTYDLVMEDCFNGTLGEGYQIAKITDYRDLQKYHHELTSRNSPKLLINTEESLNMMNITKLKFNSEGCSNTLSKECDKFFSTHATDGVDGSSPDRYTCYSSEKDESFVIGVFNPKMTYTYMVLALVLPGCIFTVSCLMLIACSKSVGVNDEGHLYLKFDKGAATGGNNKKKVKKIKAKR